MNTIFDSVDRNQALRIWTVEQAIKLNGCGPASCAALDYIKSDADKLITYIKHDIEPTQTFFFTQPYHTCDWYMIPTSLRERWIELNEAARTTKSSIVITDWTNLIIKEFNQYKN